MNQKPKVQFTNLSGRNITVECNGVIYTIPPAGDRIQLQEKEVYKTQNMDGIIIFKSNYSLILPETEFKRLLEANNPILDRRSAILCRKYRVRKNVFSIPRPTLSFRDNANAVVYHEGLEQIT